MDYYENVASEFVEKFITFCLLQKCSDYMASSIPTFARTEPPDTQVNEQFV